jgi:uncharacterized protein
MGEARYRVMNRTRGALLADRAELASGMLERMKGLLGRKELRFGEALHIVPCNSIHTFFMGFPIDALFLDRDGRIVKLLPGVAPWRTSGIYLRAHSCLELPAGTVAGSGTLQGDEVVFEPR